MRTLHEEHGLALDALARGFDRRVSEVSRRRSLVGTLPDAVRTLQLAGGLWLIAAPFYFHYEQLSPVYSNDLIVGILSAMVGAAATGMLTSMLRRHA